FLGVLVGSSRAREDRGSARSGARVPRTNRVVRAVAIAALTMLLGSFVLSAELPAVAASEASTAVVAASSSAPSAVRQAQDRARRRILALDPRAQDAAAIAAGVGARQSITTAPPKDSPTSRPLEDVASQ